eukprot:scaffold6211_cov118-Isochrysis_galbana.AAC.6
MLYTASHSHKSKLPARQTDVAASDETSEQARHITHPVLFRAGLVEALHQLSWHRSPATSSRSASTLAASLAPVFCGPATRFRASSSSSLMALFCKRTAASSSVSFENGASESAAALCSELSGGACSGCWAPAPEKLGAALASSPTA